MGRDGNTRVGKGEGKGVEGLQPPKLQFLAPPLVARVAKATANPLTAVFNPSYACVSTSSLVIYSKQQP